MEIQVLLEKIADNSYRASALSVSAEGTSEEDALEKLQVSLTQRLALGGRLVTISLPAAPSWMKYVGTWRPDDPVIDEWLQIIQENRQRDEEQAGPA